MCLCYAKGLQNETYVVGLGPIDLYSLLVRKYIYICYPPRTYVSEAATLLEGILPCCNDLSKEDGRCC
jgi:hypothetical protein